MSSDTRGVVLEAQAELERQQTLWGEQNHKWGTSEQFYAPTREYYRNLCDDAQAKGWVTWGHILLEEVFEVMAEERPSSLRTELVQVAAVCLNWAEAIDRKIASTSEGGGV